MVCRRDIFWCTEAVSAGQSDGIQAGAFYFPEAGHEVHRGE